MPIDLSDYRAVFLDGFFTLFDISDVPRRAMAAAARELGIPDAAEFGRLWLAKSNDQRWWEGPFRSIREHFAASLREILDELELTGDVDRCVEIDIQMIKQAEPYPSAKELVSRLRRRVKVALVSNADDDFLAPVLARAGLVFDHVQTSEAARCYKPSREIFALAAAALSCAPGEILMIGDSWAEDVEGALAFGARAIWLNRHGHARPRTPPPGLLAEVRDLPALAALVQLDEGFQFQRKVVHDQVDS